MVHASKPVLVNQCCPSCCNAADLGNHDYCSDCSGGRTCFDMGDPAPQVYDPAKDDQKEKKTTTSSSAPTEKEKVKEK